MSEAQRKGGARDEAGREAAGGAVVGREAAGAAEVGREAAGAAEAGDRAKEAVSLEGALVARAQRGERQALRLLLERHADALFGRVILPRAGDRAVAEDILKDTMVTAIEKLHTFRWEGKSIYFWLRQIAVNKVIDHHRSTARTSRLARTIAAEPEPTVLSAGGPGPEAALIAEEERRLNAARIRKTLEGINPRYREAIELRLVQELPREECARRLGVELGTFDVVLFRAVRSFRRRFEDVP